MFQILNRDKRTFKQQCQEKKNSPLIELKNNKPIKFDSIHEVIWDDRWLTPGLAMQRSHADKP